VTGYSRLMMAVVAVPAALPQWLVLRRYGSRSFVWLAVPVVASLAVTVIYQLLGEEPILRSYTGSGTGALRWVPLIALSGTVAGLIEGTVLAWILATEFEPTEPLVSQRSVRPHVTPAMHESRVVGLRTQLGILIALVVPIFMPKLFVETYGFPDPDILPFAFAAAAPWVVALGLLWRPGLHHAGLALAATASIIALVGMIPLIALVTLFAGWFLGDKDEWVMYAGALGATVMLLIVAVRAIRAVRTLPVSERLTWAWPATLTGCIVYAMVLATILL
jgi:hypothetical protein